MLNFTVGPVQSCLEVRKIGAEQVPYFRTPEFSEVMFENERLMKQFANTGEEARVVFITGSGTASMEAVVMNTLTVQDKALVVNGGSFGQRFVDLCRVYDVPCDEIKLEAGKALTSEMLAPYENKGYTAFLVNVHETSTGVRYDMALISAFCQRNGLFLIADAISAFLADPLNMAEMYIDVMITGSQKALACPPGISIIVLSERARERVERNNPKCMYFNLKDALKNGARGQTPFTPAVGTLLQIHARLKQIEQAGGVEHEMRAIASIAQDFREKIKALPYEIVSESLSNAVTPLHPIRGSAYRLFEVLKDEYGIWVCPNGGALKDSVFRVGHIGSLTTADNDTLIAALIEIEERGLNL